MTELVYKNEKQNPVTNSLLVAEKFNKKLINDELVLFSHPKFGEVRTYGTYENPLFVANDVCNVLSIRNSRDAIYRLDDDEVRVSVIPTPSGKQEANLVTESGLYNLIFQSRKPEAKIFRKWVTSEVLPSIRKKGYYVLEEKLNNTKEELSDKKNDYNALQIYYFGDVERLEEKLEKKTSELNYRTEMYKDQVYWLKRDIAHIRRENERLSKYKDVKHEIGILKRENAAQKREIKS